MIEVMVGFLFGLGISIIGFAFRKLRGRAPHRFDLWGDEVERAAIRCIQADLQAAESKAALVSLIGDIPKDFDASAWLGCHVAAGVHRAALLEAERQGIVRRGLMSEVYDGAMRRTSYESTDQFVPEPADYDSIPPPPHVRKIEAPAVQATITWVKGRLLPWGGAS